MVVVPGVLVSSAKFAVVPLETIGVPRIPCLNRLKPGLQTAPSQGAGEWGRVQARMPWATLPATSVSRKSRPA